MKVSSIFAILLFLIVGCSSAEKTQPMNPSSECAAIRKIVDGKVVSGMGKAEVLRFFESRGWHAIYGKLDDALVVRFEYPTREWNHVVTVTVQLVHGDRVRDVSVIDNYIAP